jgi:hypothetical protein
LLELSTRHAQNVQSACDAAIDLFDDSIRKRGADDESVSRIFRELLPQVTRLVALHFQRTLVTRALDRFRDKKEHGALAEALAATESAQLDVEVTWR